MHLGGNRCWASLSEDSNIVLQFYKLAVKLFNFLDMMFHILGDPGEDMWEQGKVLTSGKKWREEKSVLTFLWPHNLPPGPQGWMFHCSW